jgi:hypothetical protein
MYRHKMDVLSLVFGLLYAAIGVLLLRGATDFSFVSVWPVLLVLAGLALLISAARGTGFRRVEPRPAGDQTPSTVEDRSEPERRWEA